MKKLPKSVLALMSLMIFMQSALALAGRESNGGNFIALEFIDSANYAILEVQKNPDLFPELQQIDLKLILDNTKIVVVDTPLVANSINGSTQECVAINFHTPDTIEINQSEWTKLTSYIYKRALALHEILGIAGIESTGAYNISNRIIKTSVIVTGGGDPNYFLPADGKISFDDASYLYTTALGQVGLKNFLGRWDSFLVTYASSPDSSALPNAPEYLTINHYTISGETENADLIVTQYNPLSPDTTNEQQLSIAQAPKMDLDTSIHFTYQDQYSQQALTTDCEVAINWNRNLSDALWILICRKFNAEKKGICLRAIP